MDNSEIKKWLKEPRPEDLESSLSNACDIIKKLLKDDQKKIELINKCRNLFIDFGYEGELMIELDDFEKSENQK